MNNIARFTAGLLCAGAAIVLMGCGGSKDVAHRVPAGVDSSAPDWVRKPKAYEGESLYAVGIVSGVDDRSMAIDAADNRGRAKIAEVFNTYLARLGNDFRTSTALRDKSKGNGAGEEKEFRNFQQQITVGQKTFTQKVITGAIPVEHWTDPSDGTVYSLVRLDVATIKNEMKKAIEFDAQLRAYVAENAGKTFEELAAEEAKKH